MRDQVVHHHHAVRSGQNVNHQILSRHLGHASFSVEHIIQDAGSPGIEDFARQIGADFYFNGELLYSSTSFGEGGGNNSRAMQTQQDHLHVQQSEPRGNTSYRVAIYCEKDKGMYDAINRGLRRATGDICAWLNCDEQYLPGALTKVSNWFRHQSKADVLLGTAIVVDPSGDYLCSRPALPPQRLHSLVSGNLSFLSAATFFRREIIDQGCFLPDQWKIVGDAAWACQLISAGFQFNVLKENLAVFVDTGGNLSLDQAAALEKSNLAKQAPAWARKFRKLIVAHYRLRKLLSGAYFQKPFSYSIYTPTSQNQRVQYHVAKPTQFWPGRI